jgi:hypothetical protein
VAGILEFVGATRRYLGDASMKNRIKTQGVQGMEVILMHRRCVRDDFEGKRVMKEPRRQLLESAEKMSEP